MGQQLGIFWNVNLEWSTLSGEFMTYYIVWDTHVFVLGHSTKTLTLTPGRNLKKLAREAG
jgi:hypothetical protein